MGPWRSYIRGANRPVGDPFDLFIVPADAVVHAIDHHYKDSIAARSDHAIVTMMLRVTLAAIAPLRERGDLDHARSCSHVALRISAHLHLHYDGAAG
jgi:hypothetical protein